jgi:DNA-binding protein HU-beta
MKKLLLPFVAAFVAFGLLGSMPADAMNKAQLIDQLAEKVLERPDAERALNGFLVATTAALEKGEKVQIIGFGSFTVRKQTGQGPVVRDVVQFKADNDRCLPRETCVTTSDLIEMILEEWKLREEEDRGDGGTVATAASDAPTFEELEAFFEALIAIIHETLMDGEEVEIEGFGTFYATGSPGDETVVKKTVKFKAGADLARALR